MSSHVTVLAPRALLGILGTALTLALAVTGCGGGGGGGGSGNAAPTTVSPLGTTPPIRLDVRTGASAPTTSLQDQLAHQFVFPAAIGTTFDLHVEAQPSGSRVLVVVLELSAAGGTGSTSGVTAFQGHVTTPWSMAFTGSGDTVFNVSVFDDRQAGLTLSQVSALARAQQPDTSSITAFVHIAGDDFDGFGTGAGNGAYGDLATVPQMQSFVGDLLRGVNAIWAPAGVQVDVGRSGLTRLTDADVVAIDPALVKNGITVLDPGDLDLNVPARRWGNLGIASTDPSFGRSLDVFLVVQAVPGPGGAEVKGYSSGVKLRSQGGLLEGAGATHAVVLPLFDLAANPRPFQDVVHTLAHEMAHFLSLMHTTETTFVPDDLDDTPHSTSAHDTNGNGVLDGADVRTACPDFPNLMFPVDGQTQLTAEQGRAMRAYLAIRRH